MTTTDHQQDAQTLHASWAEAERALPPIACAATSANFRFLHAALRNLADIVASIPTTPPATDHHRAEAEDALECHDHLPSCSLEISTTLLRSAAHSLLAIDDRLAALGALAERALIPARLIPAPQQPQERPEPAPEGDGTTDTASGREAGAQRDDHGWHTMPPGSFVIDGEDRSDRYQCRHDGTGVVHLRYKDDAPAGAQRFKVGDWVRVVPGENGYRMPRCGEAGEITEIGPHVCTVRHPDGERCTYIAELLEPITELAGTARCRCEACEPVAVPAEAPVVLPTTPGSVVWTRDGGMFELTDDEDCAPWCNLERRGDYYSKSNLDEFGGVVRVFDAGAGQIRVHDAGTVA